MATSPGYSISTEAAAWDSFDVWLGDRFDEDEELLLLTVDLTGMTVRQMVEWELVVMETIAPRRILAHREF